jgi:SAM-dependent methyltransferase
MYKEDRAQFWEDIYLADDAGWDLGGVTPVFESIASELIPGKVCIAGCGSGHDAVMFAHRGFEVTGVDFAASAVKALAAKSEEENADVQILRSDIFSLTPNYDNVFDYVIEQTCFCAINPNRRQEYERLMCKIIKPGGKLIGLWFPLDKIITDGGPPWGTTIDDVKSIFKNGWIIEREEFPEISVQPRKNREKIIIFRKR